MPKAIVDPGEYACEWMIDGVSLAGTVEFRGSGTIRGEIFDVPFAFSDGHWSPHREDASSVSGVLRNGQTFVLHGVRIDHWFMGRARVFADLAICGLGLDVNSTKFGMIEFQVGGLVEISRKVPLVTTVPFGPGPKVFTIEWNADADSEWSDGTDTLTFGFNARYHPAELYRFSIVTEPVVRVSGRERSVQEWVQEFVEPIRGLCEIATRSRQEVRWVCVGWKEKRVGLRGEAHELDSRAQVFSREISQEPYDAERPAQPSVSLIDLSNRDVSLLDLARRWRSAAGEYQTFFELLQSVLDGNVTPRAALLALAPALESYHGQKYGSGPVSVEEHRSRRSEVLSRIKGVESLASDVKWLRKYIDARGGYSLQERLKQLFEGLDAGLREQIQSRIEPVPPDLLAVMPMASDAWEALGRLRNDLAHGGEAHSNRQVMAGARLCLALALAVALSELSLPSDMLREGIEGEVVSII